MSLTAKDLDAARRLMQQYADSAPMQAMMDETEYVARRLGDISRGRAARLIIAARQNKTTSEIQRQRRRRQR